MHDGLCVGSVPAASRRSRAASNAAVIVIPDLSEDEFYDGAVPATTQKPAAKSSSSAKKPAKPAAKPAAKSKKRKPVSDSGSGSDGEFVPSGDAASEEEEESAEEDEGASEEEEKAPAKPRKRAASKPQPAMPKRPRGGGGGTSGGTSGSTSGGTSGGGGGTSVGGGSSSLLCPPATAVSGEGAELKVDAAWYGDASDVWGEAGEFVTELAAALVCGRELRLNPHGAAGWYNARFGDAAPGCEKVLAMRYRYGVGGTNPAH